MESLDNILSRPGEAMPTPEAAVTTNEPAADTPAVSTEPTDDVSEAPDGRKMVPLEALTESRGKVKRYTEQVAEFDKSVGTLREQNANLSRQVTELLTRIPQQQQPKQEAPDWWTDPDAAFQQNLQRHLQPLIQQVNQRDELMSRRLAEKDHGPEVVNSAYQAIAQRLQSDPSAQHTYRQIMQSGDPWDSLVKWHKREIAQAKIGDDPDAFASKLEAELRERITAELNGGSGQQANGKPAPVMPSNLASARNVGARSGPAWAGPTPLASIFKN